MPPLTSLVLVNMSTSDRFCATTSIGCQCLRRYSSKLLHWLSVLTASEAPGLPTSAVLSAQSLTIQAVLVSARPNTAICSFHEPEQLGLEGGASCSSSCLELTAASLSLPVHHIKFPVNPSQFQARLKTHIFQAGLSLTFPLRTIEEVELNWVCDTGAGWLTGCSSMTVLIPALAHMHTAPWTLELQT